MESNSTHNIVPLHFLPDSERLLRTHNAWVASWDASNEEEQQEDLEALVKKAFNLYADGLTPIQVRWRLQEDHSLLPAKLLSRAQRRAEKALQAAESAPAELRRAMVAAARQRAIQGALAAGEWATALRGLERVGEIAGELRESAGLSEEDLVLTVSIESDPGAPVGALAPAETGEIQPSLRVETVETED